MDGNNLNTVIWNDFFNNGKDDKNGKFEEHSQFKIWQSPQSKVEQMAGDTMYKQSEAKVIHNPPSCIVAHQNSKPTQNKIR